MEEPTVKKEIVVKRLSAFKFAVEVNTPCSSVPRQSVIQKAPPATAAVERKPEAAESQTVLIRQAIVERIVEMLLCKLLGQKRLQEYCGYPESSTCTLLRKVIQLSQSNNQQVVKADLDCTGSIECFLEQVAEFLKICAPTEQLWRRFGWHSLSEEAILRKIYDEELSPNVRRKELRDVNLMKIYDDIQLLVQWERQGFTTISKRCGQKLLPNARSPPYPQIPHSQKGLPSRKDVLIHRKNYYRPQHFGYWPVRMQQGHQLRIFPYPHGENNGWILDSDTRRGQAYVTAKHY